MSQSFLFLGIAILTAASAQVCFKRGVFSLGRLDFSFSKFFGLIPQVFKNGWLIGGMVLFGISFLLWLFVLSRVRLNVAYPVSISLQVILIAIGSWILFKEYLSFPQVLGIGLIILGIFLMLKG